MSSRTPVEWERTCRKKKSKREAARTKQETSGMEFTADRRLEKKKPIEFFKKNSSFWSSSLGREEADRVLDLKSKSQRGKKRKAKRSGCERATDRRVTNRRSKEAQPTIKYIDG
jgi:hypothetical protein